MATIVTVEEAASTFADLLDWVSRGEEITILKEGQAIARLLPASQPLLPRVPGTAQGTIVIAPDFDDPLP